MRERLLLKKKKIDRDMKDNIYCVRMSVYGCFFKCCILNMCGVFELFENCFVIEI